jgi:hypothetical protein
MYKPPPEIDPYAIEFIRELEMPESIRVNRIPVISVLEVHVTVFFSNKKHALNT